MNFWDILLIIGLGQALYLIASLLIFNKSKVIQNKYLSLLIFAGSAHIAFELLNEIDSYLYRIILRIISISSPLLIGPSIYFFLKHSLKLDFKSIKTHFYHFIPFFILIGFLILVELTSNSISNNSSPPVYVPIIELLKTIHLTTYILLSYQIINSLKKTKKTIIYKSNTKQILLWFKMLLFLIIIAMVLSVIYFVSIKYLGFKPIIGSPRFIALILIILIYCIAFMAIRFPIIVIPKSNSLIIKRSEKYKTSSLDKERIISMQQMLIGYMLTEKPFLNSELKIESLAKEIDIPKHHLSQAINQGFEKSFQDFINDYRIQEFKKRIIDPKNSNVTILGIAFDSGFSSKSSFNRIFKSHTGITPYEFKKINSPNESQIGK
nr:helix-turn-helix domain-containing protein [uncultured Psychroserpens sp.]